MKTRRNIQYGQVTLFAVTVGAAILFLLWLMTLSGGLPRVGGTSYKVSAVLPDAGAQLVTGARVTMSGVQVGTVAKVERRGRGAVVKMTITDRDVVPLPSDSSALLRARTPLGENYMSLLPGRARTDLPEGGTIPLAQAKQAVDVDQVLSILQGPARENARRLLVSTGTAVGHQGKRLNLLVGSAGNFANSGSRVVQALYPERRQIAQLVDQLGNVAAGVGERGDDIRALAQGGLSTFRALAAQDQDLRRLARVLPGTLTQIGSTTGRIARTSDTAAPVLTELAATIHEARPAARALPAAADELNGVVHGVGRAAPPLRRALQSLQRISGPAARALPGVHRTLCQVNPVVSYAKPYVADVVAVLAHLGSASNAYDSIGHTIRLAATISQNSLVGLPKAQAAYVDTLLNAGVLSKSTGITYYPYPKPGQANTTYRDVPHANGPDTLRQQTGYVYPRVTAGC